MLGSVYVPPRFVIVIKTEALLVLLLAWGWLLSEVLRVFFTRARGGHLLVVRPLILSGVEIMGVPSLIVLAWIRSLRVAVLIVEWSLLHLRGVVTRHHIRIRHVRRQNLLGVASWVVSLIGHFFIVHGLVLRILCEFLGILLLEILHSEFCYVSDTHLTFWDTGDFFPRHSWVKI